MAKIEKPITTVDLIYQRYEQEREPHRAHLGASMIGDPCTRKLWYSFRWCLSPAFPGRVLRLFQRGQLEEAVIVEDLRKIGVQVWEVDPATGKQFQVSWHGGHFGGSCDGVAKGLHEAPKTPHALEFKTSSKKMFDKLCKEKVRQCHPRHYAQMQVYMKGLKLKRAMYLAVCKDDDRIYQERVYYDAAEASRQIERAGEVIKATTPLDLPRVSERPDFYICKMCDFNEFCHQW